MYKHYYTLSISLLISLILQDLALKNGVGISYQLYVLALYNYIESLPNYIYICVYCLNMIYMISYMYTFYKFYIWYFNVNEQDYIRRQTRYNTIKFIVLFLIVYRIITNNINRY